MTWPRRIAGADIKDKQPLMDARKSIERDMERFKACEKEAKMKGGVGGGKTNDPKEKAKEDARDWINNTVDSLTGKVGGGADISAFVQERHDLTDRGAGAG